MMEADDEAVSQNGNHGLVKKKKRKSRHRRKPAAEESSSSPTGFLSLLILCAVAVFRISGFNPSSSFTAFFTSSDANMMKHRPNEIIQKAEDSHFIDDSKYSCIYNADQGKKNQQQSECYQLLSPHVQSKPIFHFFGDEQMGHLIRNLKYPFEHYIVRKGFRCRFMEYIGIDRENITEWKKPNITQGPVAYGLQHPYCSDTAGHKHLLIQATNRSNYMEFITIDFASDVSQQTLHTRTTQETAALYLKLQFVQNNVTKEENVCIMNTGRHDQELCKNFNSTYHCYEVYLFNVETYLTIFDNVCSHMIWIGINAIKESPLNKVSIRWNHGVKELGNRLFPNFFYIDVWTSSTRYRFKDTTHFEPAYYEGLASIFTYLMMPVV
ncbi:hypothetical protein CTEN210_18032 [Chaetoceros tenuissimus]|uniref:Uncharacterized protein n=1 Tax=Chaetoceros tenuissimus TaxID=426638 RepID=A0AAD3DBZ7_9STRA|nr:hypothetical protein CTEN210_18032 [Chaetoceros tenuissimus]